MHDDMTASPNSGYSRPLVRRRTFLGAAGAATLAVGLDSVLSRSAQAMAASSTAPLAYFDMSSLNSVDMTNTAQLTAAYDEVQLVSSLQGLVNRDEAVLFVNFLKDADQYWLSKLQASGQWLAERPLSRIPDLDTLVAQFGDRARGAVIWDPKVPATANVATTAAGADDLLVIRYDPSPGSLYSQYVTSGRFPARVSLVNANGSSLFTGNGTIPGTSLPSSGSAKCDAYLWAKARYLDTGRTNPSEMGYHLDAYWLTKPKGGLSAADLVDRDYLVANRSFVLDLSPWSDLAPEDDPGQPLGTDRRTFEAILQSAYNQVTRKSDANAETELADRGLIAMRGFVPWPWKYSSGASSGDWHDPVGGEWESVQLFSSYNVYLDAGTSVVNTSLYQHYPVASFYPQNPKPTLADFKANGYVDADGNVAPKRYIAFYLGDYDSAGWLYYYIPSIWDDPERGTVPMSWAFDPNLDRRMAPVLVHTRQTRSAKDFFIAGDSGAGYVNPGAYQQPRPDSKEPTGVDAWTRHCRAYYGRWDISLSGFNIDGFSDALSEDALAASYGQFSPDGVVGQKAYRVGMTGNLPYLRQAGDLPSEAPAQAAAYLEQNYLNGDTSKPPLQPEFTVIRTILQGPSWHKQIMDQVTQDKPDAAVEFVDAYTLLGLVRQHLADRVTLYPQRALVSPSTPTPVLLGAVNHRPGPVTIDVRLQAPQGWLITPSHLTTTLTSGEDTQISFEVSPSSPAGTTAALTATVTGPGISEQVLFTTQVIDHSYAGASSVAVTLGATNQPDGLSQIDNSFNGQTKATTVAGKEARQLVITANGFTKASFMYFDVADTFMFDEQNADASVTVEYFDTPGQQFSLEYDSPDTQGRPMNGIFTEGGTVTTTGTNTWKTHQFHLRHVYFGNRQMAIPDYRIPGFADFRIASAHPITLAKVSVAPQRPL